MGRKIPLIALVAYVSAALAAGGPGGLVGSKTSFATSTFCRLEGCRFLGATRILSEPGGYWTKDDQYQLRKGGKVLVVRYDDPGHPSERGRVIAMSMVFRGNGSELVASRFSTLGSGQAVTAQQLAQCFSKARTAPPSGGDQVSWLPNDRTVGVRCAVKSGGMKELVVTVID